jgi:hypothetical protein
VAEDDKLFAPCPKCGNVPPEVWLVGDEGADSHAGIPIAKVECPACHEVIYRFRWGGKDVWFTEDAFVWTVGELLLHIRNNPGKAVAIGFTYFQRGGAWVWDAFVAEAKDVYEGTWMPDAGEG